MPKDRDQLTPADPEDAEYLRTHRGQGTAGTGLDRLPGDGTPVGDDGTPLTPDEEPVRSEREATDR